MAHSYHKKQRDPLSSLQTGACWQDYDLDIFRAASAGQAVPIQDLSWTHLFERAHLLLQILLFGPAA